MHVAELIALVNDRLTSRLSLRYLANSALAGSAIANIVVGPQVLPIAAQVALSITTDVAAHVLPVGAQVGLVSRKIPSVSLNVRSVAGEVALIVHALTLAGAAMRGAALRRNTALGLRRGDSRDPIVVVAAQVLPIGTQISLISRKVLPVGAKVGPVLFQILPISMKVTLVSRDVLPVGAKVSLILLQILPVGVKVGLVSR